MTWLRLAWANMLLAPVATAVNVLLMGLGTASIVLLLLAGVQISQTMSRDAENVDLVVGAKGSPVQLVLSSVYHADVPPGNIRLGDVERWMDDGRVAQLIPLSLGDSFQGFRIVGTTPAYLDLYAGVVAKGRTWGAPMEAVLGASVAAATGKPVGSTFAGAHGLVGGGHLHDAEDYFVVGVLAPTGTVLDRLVVTSLESVWELHEEVPHGDEEHARAIEHRRDEGYAQDEAHQLEEGHDHDEGHEHDQEHDHDQGYINNEGQRRREAHEPDAGQAFDPDLEITAALLTYRTPLAATTLPREINSVGSLQAAAPAMEISRILQLVGVAMDALNAFGWVLVGTAGLSIFAALYGSLRTRRGELAMLRCLGASRAELLLYLVGEGLLMSLAGIALGFIAGHGVMELVGLALTSSRGIELTGWTWLPVEATLMFSLLLVGICSAMIPALQAYRTDVARTLAEG